MPIRLNRRAALAGVAATLTPLSVAVADARRTDGQPGYLLRAAPARRKLSTDASTEAELWLFNDDLAEPVLRVRHGDELSVTLRNDTPKPLALHWHGVRGVNSQDGVGGLTQVPVPPGGVGSYRFTPPDSGTFPIRPIVLGGSGEAAGRGLGGLLVVDEREPPTVDAEFALVMRDWRLEPSGALSPFGDPLEAALGGRLGNRIGIGGGDAPKRVELPPGSRVRLRITNGANARALRIRFDGLRAFVLAVDGQPTETFEPLRSTLPFAPGSRYDLAFDMPAEPGSSGSVVGLIGPGMPLVTFVVGEGARAPERPPIAGLPPNRALPPAVKLQNALRRSLTITGGAIREGAGPPVFTGDPKAIWKVNGTAGALGAPPLFSTRRGQPVVLAINNATSFVQPLHIHGHFVRLLHPLDDGWEPYWLDTFQVPEGKTVQVAFEADNPGRWLLGSSVLERLDTGLWTTFDVA